MIATITKDLKLKVIQLNFTNNTTFIFQTFAEIIANSDTGK